MGHRDTGERGRGDRRADARHDLERNPGGRERQPFFAAAAEDERVTALESHDFLAGTGGANHQPVDGLLPDLRPAGPLADKDALRRRRERERRGIDERVVEHEVGVGQTSGRLAREQIGIAGPGADERHEAPFRLRSGHSGWQTGRGRPHIRVVRGVRGPFPIVQIVERLQQQRPPLGHRHALRQPVRGGPLARRPSSVSSSSGRSTSSASRIRPARAGASPSVDIAIVTPAFCTIAPAYALALSRSSTALTKRQRASAACATARLTSGGAAATTYQAPSTSAGLERPADDRESRCHRRDLVDHVGSHDRDARPCVHERAQLARRHWTGADHEDAPPFELEEHGENRHGPPVVGGVRP